MKIIDLSYEARPAVWISLAYCVVTVSSFDPLLPRVFRCCFDSLLFVSTDGQSKFLPVHVSLQRLILLFNNALPLLVTLLIPNTTFCFEPIHSDLLSRLSPLRMRMHFNSIPWDCRPNTRLVEFLFLHRQLRPIDWCRVDLLLVAYRASSLLLALHIHASWQSLQTGTVVAKRAGKHVFGWSHLTIFNFAEDCPDVFKLHFVSHLGELVLLFNFFSAVVLLLELQLKVVHCFLRQHSSVLYKDTLSWCWFISLVCPAIVHRVADRDGGLNVRQSIVRKLRGISQWSET